MLNNSLYKISDFKKIDPFLMTLTSASNHWMYVSSSGCLTAGRQKAEYALFPYVTDDLLHRNAHFTGPVTIIKVKKDDKYIFWQPFSSHESHYEKQQNLYKNSLGNILVFEEINHTLGLTFIYDWQTSEKYGFVKKSCLTNNSHNSQEVELIDGLKNILPAGIELRTQQEMSNLANAYKISEYNPNSHIALYFMNALLMDRPEPGESLYTNIVWSYYKDQKNISVNEKTINEFLENKQFKSNHLLKGKSGSFLTHIEKNLRPENDIYWYTVADVQKSQTDVTRIISEISDTTKIEQELEESVRKNHSTFEQIIGSADGFQCTRNRINDLHHTANVTYNVLRGGIFFDNYNITKKRFIDFIQNRNTKIFEKYNKHIKALPEIFGIKELKDFGDKIEEPSLKRLCREYLPLTLGRRHGDPSRPWNHFNIKTKDKMGEPILYYEGNWRDIFQNWEALGFSYPQAWESMVCTFLNATSVDGYNPYRITSNGIDWEVSDLDDPWSFIGYWNDHQIIYLLKLLERLNNYDPKLLTQLFKKKIFSYANIPYKLRSFKKIAENPKETIDFDFKEDSIIQNLVEHLGSDGKLVLKSDKTVYHVNMCEKLLVLSLAKICNYVPGAGIWLNTQRPEWNDANNALVGNGASMVTVYYLRRFLDFFQGILNQIDEEDITISTEVWWWFEAVEKIVLDRGNNNHGSFSDKERMLYVSSLGKIFEKYRNKVYLNGFDRTINGSLKKIRKFIITIKISLDQTIKMNKSNNMLFESYNTIKVDVKNQSIDIKKLDLMLEGQVAALSSKVLNPDDTVELLDSLFSSALYRNDMNSFILYPKKKTSSFLQKNIINSNDIKCSELLTQMVKANDFSIIEIDVKGVSRFKPQFRNKFDLGNLLDEMLKLKLHKDLVLKDKELIMRIFEDVFDHRSFTGRSGTMFSYEGIGSIYWHMVSKLLLAIQENFFQANHQQTKNSKVIKSLGALYYRVRNGLSAAKSPEEYGAFPFDPYSHTPSHSGAQQPGMTGQVKEEILTRFGELGCFVESNCIKLDPSLLLPNEFLTKNKTFTYFDVAQHKRELRIKKDQLAYTFCQVPFLYSLSDQDTRIELSIQGESKTNINGNKINQTLSNYIFDRQGKVEQVELYINKKYLLKNIQ